MATKSKTTTAANQKNTATPSNKKVCENLEITNVQVFPTADQSGKLKAFARVCLNDALQLTSLRVYEGSNGLFIAYPNDPNYKGQDYKQILYPVSKGVRDMIETTIIEEYNKEIEEV